MAEPPLSDRVASRRTGWLGWLKRARGTPAPQAPCATDAPAAPLAAPSLAALLEALPHPALLLGPAGQIVASRAAGPLLTTQLRQRLLAGEPSIDITARDGRVFRPSIAPLDEAPGWRLVQLQPMSAVTSGGPTIPVTAMPAWAEGLPAPIWLRNTAGEVIWANKALRLAAGPAGPSQFAGESLFQKALSESVGREERRAIIDGERRLLRLFEARLRAGGSAGLALDMTELDELRRDVVRLISAQRELIENLRVGIVMFGADRRIAFYNTAFAELWKLESAWLDARPSLGDLLDRLRDRRLLPEQQDFRRYRQDQLSLFTRLLEPQDSMVYRPDGRVIRELIVPDPQGGLIMVHDDVSSTLQLESSYNTLMAVQRETLDNLTEGISVFGEDGRLSLWNPAFARIWGLSEDWLAGRPHIRDVAHELAQRLLLDQAEHFAGMMVATVLERVPGARRLVLDDETTLDHASVPLPDGGVLLSFVDVSDSVRVAEALAERNAALEEADQLKLHFLANVSYQLRTPLNTMLGFAEILVNQYFGPLNQRQLEYAQGLLEAGERLVQLVDAILDLSTIEAGYLKLELQRVEVSQLLADMRDLTEEWARKHGLIIEIDAAEDIGRLMADPRRLKQVLVNLIANAIRFTPPGGRIVLAAYRLPDEMVVAVSDTGVGVPPEDGTRLLQSLEPDPPAEGPQAGLGLALVRRFVALHGGRVEVASEPGRGTIVTCYFPDTLPLSELTPEEGAAA